MTGISIIAPEMNRMMAYIIKNQQSLEALITITENRLRGRIFHLPVGIIRQ